MCCASFFFPDLGVVFVCSGPAMTGASQCLTSHLSLQFTLEDARERLSSLGQSPDRNLRSRLEAGPGMREQRHSVHVVTSSSPSSAADKGKSVEKMMCSSDKNLCDMQS